MFLFFSIRFYIDEARLTEFILIANFINLSEFDLHSTLSELFSGLPLFLLCNIFCIDKVYCDVVVYEQFVLFSHSVIVISMSNCLCHNIFLKWTKSFFYISDSVRTGRKLSRVKWKEVAQVWDGAG